MFCFFFFLFFLDPGLPFCPSAKNTNCYNTCDQEKARGWPQFEESFTHATKNRAYGKALKIRIQPPPLKKMR
uniref:Putative secreted protein n=1 Tax=Rhipicephalus microplus TaxID=6941 RepID=A0A6M2DED5_RHIMP